jgi:glucose/arabinose dehydrogenase
VSDITQDRPPLHDPAPGEGIRPAAGPVDEHGVRRQLLPSIIFRFVLLFAFLGLVGYFVLQDRPSLLPFDLDTADDGIEVTIVADGLTLPVAVAVAANNEVFIAEKAGVIKYLPSLENAEPSVLVDLSPEVHDLGDRGLLGIATHPNFPQAPFVYALYTRDAPPGGEAPTYKDTCPDLGQIQLGCVVGGRLVEIEVNSGGYVGERTLLEDRWCQIFVSHGVADIAFGPDGMLYVGAGDGASYEFPDEGQNDDEYPSLDSSGAGCGGEPNEQGAFRVQDAATGSDPLNFNGSIVRIDVNADVIEPELVAYGFRNPFGLNFREGTDELWVIDVGWADYEEVNIVDLLASEPSNHGWPCREGPLPTMDYQNDDQCEALEARGAGTFTEPFWAQDRTIPIDGCEAPPISFTDLAFLPSEWGADMAGGLLVADWGTGCVALLPPGPDGMPSAVDVRAAITNAIVVDMEPLPNGSVTMLNIGQDFAEGYLVLLTKS